MDTNRNGDLAGGGSRGATRRPCPWGNAPGIMITDGGVGSRASGQHPRVRAFVYGERLPDVPTLPFGRWKVAS
jgi:hypothetical protein